MTRQSAHTSLLITMPWAPVHLPSLPLGLLKAHLGDAGMPATTSYANIRFASLMGVKEYERLINDNNLRFVAEWLFNRSLFSKEATRPARDREQLEHLLHRSALTARRLRGEADAGPPRDETRGAIAALLRLRDHLVPRFLHQEAERDEVRESAVIGFTCTFNQTVASLALARLIKRAHPEKFIVFGGFCFSRGMGEGYMRSFPWIDCCVLGEGERTAVELFRAAGNPDAREEGLARLDDICWRRGDEVITNAASKAVFDLEQSPVPDYADYFREVEQCRQRGVGIPQDGVGYETSRGCWWGQRRGRCAFCGLDNDQLPHRVKSSEKIVREIQALSSRYEVLRCHLADTLLPRRVLNQVMPAIPKLDCDFSLVCELRATMTKAQIRDLADAGARLVQIGVESFSTALLALMGKGTSALDNIQALKWCAETGIQVHYNLLFGVPGDEASHYEEMNALLPLLVHLAPPKYPPSPILFVRNSAYLGHPGRYGLGEVVPYDEYRVLYPGLPVEAFAYYFRCTFPGSTDTAPIRALAEIIKTWRKRREERLPPILRYRKGPGFVEITDRRGCGTRTIRLTGATSEVFLFCDEIRSYPEISDHLSRARPEDYSDDNLEEILGWLAAHQLVVAEDRRYLALATRDGGR